MTLSQISIRTPLTCKLSLGVCQVCYGWNLATGKMVELGESIGILAAQSIGEPGTQLTMRTFHTGGVFSGEAKATILSPFTGKIWYDYKNGGKKIYTKYKEKAFLSDENKKVIIYQNNISKSIMYLPKNSVVFTKPGKIIFDKQIIAELPKLKKDALKYDFLHVKNKFPGQVYFEKEKNKTNKKNFLILSANVLTYNTFLVRLINKFCVKNVNFFLSKEKRFNDKENNKRITKSSFFNISLKNILSVSKKKFKKTTSRFVNMRLVLKKDKVILTNKTSSERAVSRSKFDLKLGKLLRADDVFGNFKNFYPLQVIQETKDVFLIRKTSSPYSKKNSLLKVGISPFVIKDTIVSFSSYKKQKAEDIVQGLPKVDQLFEARRKISKFFSKNLHYKLATCFDILRYKYTNKVAVRKSLFIMQDFILRGIQSIYQSQGVDISDKHIEVIIKQMTSKVMITSSGDSSFIIGDIIDLYLVENINDKIINKVIYEPIIIGITRLSLSSPSFIAAASFQETAKVLLRSALEGKIDWLYGLKENLVLGNIIPAGTGFNKTY